MTALDSVAPAASIFSAKNIVAICDRVIRVLKGISIAAPTGDIVAIPAWLRPVNAGSREGFTQPTGLVRNDMWHL